jgi:hypothetical protein
MAFTSWALTRHVRTAAHRYKENLCHIHQAAEAIQEEATVAREAEVLLKHRAKPFPDQNDIFITKIKNLFLFTLTTM